MRKKDEMNGKGKDRQIDRQKDKDEISWEHEAWRVLSSKQDLKRVG